MCMDPVSLAGAAIGGGISAAGGMADNRAKKRENRLNSWANVQRMEQDTAVAKKRNEVLNQYVGRQKGFVDENQGALANTVSQFGADNQEAQRAGNETERAAFLQQQLGAAAPGEVPLHGSASPAVQGEMAKRLGEAFAHSQRAGNAAAHLGSFADGQADNTAAIAQGARAIDTTNNFARGDISMLGADQDLQEFPLRKTIYVPTANGNNPGSMLKGIGSLVGSLAGAYGGKAGVSWSSLLGGAGGSGSMGFASPTQRS